MLSIRFKRLSPQARTPQRMTSHAAGYDLAAALTEDLILPPGGRACVPTGIAIALPAGYEAQIRPRSGLAVKHGIGILNSPGTVDSDFRGEIKVILFNISDTAFTVTDGMRIAQMVIASVTETSLEETTELDATDRHEGGFGHTGYH